MTKWILVAGAASLAIMSPALADPGKQGGKSGDKGGGKSQMKADRGNQGGGKSQMKADRGNQGGGEHRFASRGGDRGPAKIRGNDNDRGKARAFVNRGDDKRSSLRVRDRDDDRRIARIDHRNDRRDVRLARFDDDNHRGWRGFNDDNCPPGLRRKNNGCMPPGQAKKLVGTLLPAALGSRTLAGAYRDWYRDDDRYTYRYDDDYIYRVQRNGGLIDALIPAYDRDFSYYPLGMSYPSQYNSYNVPYQYRSYYPDGNDLSYRYGDGAIYGVNPQTGLVQSIVALLAGDMSVGQRMPLGYSTYNVPLSYRDRYYDTPDAMYRYNDGYIYRADPKTQLITAVINALV